MEATQEVVVGRAAELAFDLHRLQTNKNGTPYFAHVAEVAALVAAFGGSPNQIAAAFLHDALEDQPREGETERRILERCNPEVLYMVQDCTKPPKADYQDAGWRARMRAYAAQQEDGWVGSILVFGCDKFVNARATYADLLYQGLSIWDKFASGREKLWYHRLMANTVAKLYPGLLADQLQNLVFDIERLDMNLTRDL
jgi:(p)ppGpp synthase/HD superfamily hydrolase